MAWLMKHSLFQASFSRKCLGPGKMSMHDLIARVRLDLGNALGRANTGDKMTGLPVARHTGESGYDEWGRRGWE